jgi:ribosome biogenesis protein YTM1
MMASGDWDGGISLWSVPTSSLSSPGANDNNNNNEVDKPKKKRKGSTSATIGNDVDDGIHEVKPLTSVNAHSSNVAGLVWGHHDGNSSPTTLLSGSWDHGLKVYDTARMDCVLTLNGSRVVSAMDRCSNGNVVATGSPDCIVRLWDMRTNNNGSIVSSSHIGGMDKSLRQSHKSWVSSVKWSPTDPFILASTSHDGTMKIWDIRSYLPLHTVNAVNNKKLGEKALCLAFGDGVIYSGGSDCVVKQFYCNV